MKDDLSLLIARHDIERTVSRLAGQISEDYRGRQLVVVGVLKGAFIF
ncbi:MAG: hypoxanthine phosphoribosyltransferase, partial [Chloroflexi bacterium]|nr:hypoxanthine phosphoribosyltransferase [Chloroflexota bacterium]